MTIATRAAMLAAIAGLLSTPSSPANASGTGDAYPYESGYNSDGYNVANASPEEVAKIREDRMSKKEYNFRKRLPKGHPDRIES